jgi:hypothetical protein
MDPVFRWTNPCHIVEETVSTKSLIETFFEDTDSDQLTENAISGAAHAFEDQISTQETRFNEGVKHSV